MRPWHLVIGTLALGAIILSFAARRMGDTASQSVAEPTPIYHAAPAPRKATRTRATRTPVTLQRRRVRPHSPDYGRKSPPLRTISMDDALNGASLKGNVAIDPCLDTPMTLEDCADSYDPWGCGKAVADDEIYREKYC